MVPLLEAAFSLGENLFINLLKRPSHRQLHAVCVAVVCEQHTAVSYKQGGDGGRQGSYVTLTTNTCGHSKVVKHGYDDLYYKQPRDAWPLTPHILPLARTVLIVEGKHLRLF